MFGETPPPELPPAPPPKKERRDSSLMRSVRVGKWTHKPSPDGAAFVVTFLKRYFFTEKVWTRKEHTALVVAVKENVDNTALVEEFRFNRTMDQRFLFTEVNGVVEVQLQPLL